MKNRGRNRQNRLQVIEEVENLLSHIYIIFVHHTIIMYTFV